MNHPSAADFWGLILSIFLLANYTRIIHFSILWEIGITNTSSRSFMKLSYSKLLFRHTVDTWLRAKIPWHTSVKAGERMNFSLRWTPSRFKAVCQMTLPERGETSQVLRLAQAPCTACARAHGGSACHFYLCADCTGSGHDEVNFLHTSS